MRIVQIGRTLRSSVLASALLMLVALPAAATTQCRPAATGGERCVAGLSPGLLQQLQQTQRASNWCWAASISMVLRRYGPDVPQEDIVREQLGDAAANTRISEHAILGLLNRSWRDAQGREVVSSARPLPAWRRRAGLAAPEVLDDLASGKPLLVAMQQHAMVLVQVEYERPPQGQLRLLRALVLDPAAPTGLRWLREPEATVDFVTQVDIRSEAGGAVAAQGMQGAEAGASL